MGTTGEYFSNIQEVSNLEPGERNTHQFNVRREGGNSIGAISSSTVLGRLIMTNYRVRFVVNGKSQNFYEVFDPSSIPYGCI